MKRLKFCALILILALCALSLISCGGTSMTDEEAASILAALVPKSQELNSIFWGNALPLADENPQAVMTVTAAQYYPVSPESAYQSVEQLKADAEKIFSSDYLEDIYGQIFDGYSYTDESGNEVKVEPRYRNDKNGVLARDITSDTLEFSTVIDTSSAHITDSGEDIVRVSVKCTVRGKDSEMKITLRRQLSGEEYVWLLDSPTY